MPNNDGVLTVSSLNRYIKYLFEEDANLKSLYVKGQISNFKNNTLSGHYYFTLKDEKAQVRAVMFRSANQKLKFLPENDMSVIVKGYVSLYEASGEYQIYVSDMQPDGTGALAIAFEQLKNKLEKEGLFNPEHKKFIPEFPKNIGVVTSESGAAVRDIINVISRRYPVVNIILCPVSVQGEQASAQIAAAIDKFNQSGCADVLIVGRGGGSIEDLWAFNEEITARAVYNSKIPVISAVGHETDFTICDFVADLRAPTPSAAAELAVPDINELYSRLSGYASYFKERSESLITEKNSKLKLLEKTLISKSPASYIENLGMQLDKFDIMLKNGAEKYLSAKKNKFEISVSKLEANSPLKILSKGYSVVKYREGTVTDASVLKRGDIINITFNNGAKDCEVL